LKSVAIVAPLVAGGEASANCWHGYSSCQSCAYYQAWGIAPAAPSVGLAPVFPAMAPVAGYAYQAPVAPAAVPVGWAVAGYPCQAPATPAPAAADGLFDGCEGYAEMTPVADYAALVNGKLLAAHIFQNLGKAAQKYAIPVGLDLATIMFQNATRGLQPTPRERWILEQIVASYLRRGEGVPPPSVGGEPSPTVPSGDGKTYTIVVPPSVHEIRIQIQIGDGRSEAVEPEPDSPHPTAEPDEARPAEDQGEARPDTGGKVL
jgi:hypothetical protein